MGINENDNDTAHVISLDRARRLRSPRRRVHRKKLLGGQVLSFPLHSRDHCAPGTGGDAPPLLPLADGPRALANVGGHGRNGVPATEDVSEGPHSGTNIAPDELSGQGPAIIPLTPEDAGRTMCPMGRGVTPSRIKKELADRLKAARLTAGYDTHQKAAAALGVHVDRYRKWESGRTPIPAQYVQPVCSLFGVDANYLFGVEPRVARKIA